MSQGKDAVWGDLTKAGLVEGARPSASEEHAPWFVRLLMGIGGWLGAIFLIGFVAAGFRFVLDSAAGSIVTGIVLCAGAAFLFRLRGEGDFFAHFGFAMSLTGQILMAWGIARGFERNGAAAALTIGAAQAALFLVINQPLHRVWAAATSAYALAFALGDLRLAPYAAFPLTVFTAWVWLHEFDAERAHPALRAAGYGVGAVAIVWTSLGRTSPLEWFFAGRGLGVLGGEASQWVGAALSASVLVWACLELLKREGVAPRSASGRVALAIAAVLALASVKAPGLAPAIIILVLGFANGNRVLAIFGAVALVGYLSHYYYSLAATLLEKSALLAAVGAALLVMRLAVHRLWPLAHSEENHA